MHGYFSGKTWYSLRKTKGNLPKVTQPACGCAATITQVFIAISMMALVQCATVYAWVTFLKVASLLTYKGQENNNLNLA